MHYRTKGTCATGIDLEIENGVITSCSFTRGCTGNLIGLSRLVVGQEATKIMETLRGIACQGATSCPDQLSRAIEAYMNQTPQLSKEL